MKKVIAMALSLATIALALAGCAQSSTPAPQSSAPAGESQAAPSENATPSAQQVTVKLGIWPEDDLTDDIKMHEGFVQTFSKTHPNVTIQPDYYKYATDTFVSLAESGKLPTVFESWYTEPKKLIDGDFVADITDELKDCGWPLESINPMVKDLLTRDGRVYGVPRDGYALGLMLNVELFKEAGLVNADGTPPSTRKPGMSLPRLPRPSSRRPARPGCACSARTAPAAGTIRTSHGASARRSSRRATTGNSPPTSIPPRRSPPCSMSRT